MNISYDSDTKVLVPLELDESTWTGEVWGYFRPVTNIFVILAWDEATRDLYASSPLQRLGTIAGNLSSTQISENMLAGTRNGDGVSFIYKGIPCQKEKYQLTQNIFSRNTGILESAWMLDKTVFIAGCGSVGSLVALEMARSGVGKYVLVDNDILAFHNICRHQCGIHEVGRYKVDVLRERILHINPTAQVKAIVGTVEDLAQEVFETHLGSGTVMIGCADNREADIYACMRAAMYETPYVSIGFWERAFAGEIFYYLPKQNMPCYECALGGGNEAMSSRVSTSHRYYTTQENPALANFEPGISVDISYVTVIGIKLILDILNRENNQFTPRLLPHLTQFTLVCNTNNPRVGGEMAEIFAHPLQVTTSLKVKHCGDCPPCKYTW